MQVKLAYGRAGLQVDVPDDPTTVVEPVYVPGLADERQAVTQALRQPIESPPLRSLVQKDQQVAIAVCDITRAMPSSRVLPVLLQELSHVPAERIVILVATGTHRPNTEEELEGMLGRQIVQRYRVVNHDSSDASTLTHLGETPDGIPIWLNRIWTESDIRITTGFVEPHFFAGFSGGPKLVAPGLAGLETVMHLHGPEVIADPHSTWGEIENNPIHKAIRYIARLSQVSFSLDVTLNEDHQITAVFGGQQRAAHQAGCEFVRRTAMTEVRHPFEVVVTTNSGYPLDLNLYQAVKGMSAAARIVRPGGSIICAAECSDGIPSHGEYGKILVSADGPRQILEMIHTPGYACRDQWQAQLQAQIQLQARVYLKASYLSPNEIRAAHLEPVDNLETTIRERLRESGPEARLCVLPQGPQSIPYWKESSAPVPPS